MIYVANGDSQETIAKKTAFSQWAISRELKKGEGRGAYNPFLAQRKTHSYSKK
jgi:IS30 family transposase